MWAMYGIVSSELVEDVSRVIHKGILDVQRRDCMAGTVLGDYMRMVGVCFQVVVVHDLRYVALRGCWWGRWRRFGEVGELAW